MNTELVNLAAIIKNCIGKDISVFESSFLINTLNKRKAELNLKDTVEFFNLLKSDSEESKAFFQSLSIKYSDFFRESIAFSMLEKYVLPKVISQIRKGQEIRIWSVGCAYGQEPYSLAMLLSDLVESEKKEVRYRIFATDISEQAVNRGTMGIFNHDAVRNVKLYQLEKYFIKQENAYAVIPQIKNNINFSYYDILDKTTNYPPETIYGDFNIIMCCNLLIYYNQENKKKIIEKLRKALLPGGYLITGDVVKKCVEDMTKQKAVNASGPVFFKDFV